jgi:hypothetical protein
MANLFFPQLSSGALTQYPVKRVKNVHTAGYDSEDGSKIMYFDPNGSSLVWQLSYTGLTQDELTSLETLFESCCGQFRGFTFLDPVANLLTGHWQLDPLVQISGTVYANSGSAPASVSQTLPIPAGYVYTFSLTGDPTADPTATLTVIRRGPNSQKQTVIPLNQSLLVSSDILADSGIGFSIAVQLQPGQSIDLGQAQLEAQPSPSPFRPPQGGVYTDAHWASDQLTFVADGPNSYSTKFNIETHV